MDSQNIRVQPFHTTESYESVSLHVNVTLVISFTECNNDLTSGLMVFDVLTMMPT